MGKLKRSSVVKKNQKSGKSKQAKLTIEELLDYAENCIDQYELETAYQYVKRALDIDPKHVDALNTMASVQMEMGNVESAKTIYQKLVEVSPNEGFSKYMCLAQLSTGMEAVNFYKKGIELMIEEYNKQELTQQQKQSKPTTSSKANKYDEDDFDDDENGGRVTKSDISTAFGSIAEIYLTDLCMEEDAENLCKSYLDKSLEYDTKNAETLQLYASYWLSKENVEQAKKLILESVDTWLPKYIEASEAGPLVDPTQAITLTYDSRINASRILTEVEEYDKSITVLEQLVEEDDEIVVVWYMLGWVNYCKGEDYYSNAKFYLKKANELAAKIKYEQRFLDDELRSHINELLEKLVHVPSDDEGDEVEEKENMNGDEDANDDEYDTLSEDDEDDEATEDNQGKNSHLSKDSKTTKLKSLKISKPKLTTDKSNLEESMDCI